MSRAAIIGSPASFLSSEYIPTVTKILLKLGFEIIKKKIRQMRGMMNESYNPHR